MTVIPSDTEPVVQPPQHLVRTGLEMLRPYRGKTLWALVTVVGALATTLAGPSLVQYAINDGLVDHHSMRVVDIAGIAYMAVTIGSFFFTRWQTRLLSGTGELVLNDLRKRVFSHLLSHPLSFYDTESSGQLLSRMTADIDVLESLVQSGLGTFVMSVGMFVASIVVLIVISPLMFVVTFVCLVPVLVAAAHYRTDSTRAYGAVRARIGETLAALDEGLAGVRVIQAFRRERRVDEDFEVKNTRQYETEMTTVRLSSRFFPKVEGSGVIATATILLIGGLLVDSHLTSVGAVAAYVLYVANLFNSIQSLSQLFDLLQSSGAAMATVVNLLDTKPEMVDPTEPVTLPRKGTLELRGVSFSYGHDDDAVVDVDDDMTDPDAPPPEQPAGSVLAGSVLADIDLAVEQGKHLVLVGPTGAGKSTLAKLIGRLYDPSRGSIRFGGVDLRRASMAGLRERIVIVPQEGFLFRGTVLDNILIGRPGAQPSDALAAVAQLGLTERLDELPDGLDTDVGERGSHLSAGERQLVSLARAALTDPAVLVMDEATSSIDPGTELHVERAFAALTEGRTTITVAHRLTIAERADRVALIDDGNVVEVGAHDDLVAADGAYARLFAAWQGDTADDSDAGATS